MQEISSSFERLVSSATISVESSKLNVHPGQDAFITIRTVSEAGGNLKVVFSNSNLVAMSAYSDVDGVMTLQWHVGPNVKPGNYPVYVNL